MTTSTRDAFWIGEEPCMRHGEPLLLGRGVQRLEGLECVYCAKERDAKLRAVLHRQLFLPSPRQSKFRTYRRAMVGDEPAAFGAQKARWWVEDGACGECLAWRREE